MFVVAIAILLIFFLGQRCHGVSLKSAVVGLIGQFWKLMGSRRRGIGALGLLCRLYFPTVTELLKVMLVREA